MNIPANREAQGVLASALSRALQVLEGEAHLAAYLGVSGLELHSWRDASHIRRSACSSAYLPSWHGEPGASVRCTGERNGAYAE